MQSVTAKIQRNEEKKKEIMERELKRPKMTEREREHVTNMNIRQFEHYTQMNFTSVSALLPGG